MGYERMAGGVVLVARGRMAVFLLCAVVALSAVSATVIKSKISAPRVLLSVALKTLTWACSTL